MREIKDRANRSVFYLMPILKPANTSVDAKSVLTRNFNLHSPPLCTEKSKAVLITLKRKKREKRALCLLGLIICRLLALIIKHTVTISLEIRVGYLLPEFLANALVVFRLFHAARTISSARLQSFFDCFDYFLVFVKSYHNRLRKSLLLYILYCTLTANYSQE